MNEKNLLNERIRSLADLRKISTGELFERSGLKKSFWTNLEQEDFRPGIHAIVKIARVLGVSPGTLLDDKETTGPVVCRKQKPGLGIRSRASGKSGRHMEPFHLQLNGDEQPEFSSHEGEEFLYGLSGKLKLEYGKEVYTLEEGDSIYYDSVVPHRLKSEGPAQVIAVLYGLGSTQDE